MATLASIVEVKDLDFRFGTHQVIKDAAFSIDQHALTVIMGLNGSGKSTLLRLLCGLLPYSEGSIKIFGKEINAHSYRERARLLGFLPQRHKAVFPFSVKEVVLTGRAGHVSYMPGKEDRDHAHRAMEKVGILKLADRPYTELSGGEQQLVLIARVLTQQPRILVLDEPASHLDFRNQVKLMKLLKSLVEENVAVLVSMHEPNLAFGFGDRHLFVQDKQVFTIDGEKPWDHPRILETFGEYANKVDFKGKSFFVPA
jgi:iron complex transport system ATP-binding protein